MQDKPIHQESKQNLASQQPLQDTVHIPKEGRATTRHPYASLINLPYELHEMIVSLLTKQELTLCIRVCRSWNTVFTPLIWRVVQSKSWAKGTTTWEDAFTAAMETGALITMGDFIVRMDLDCGDSFINKLLSLSPETFPRLSSLELQGRNEDDTIAGLIRRSGEGLKRFVTHNGGIHLYVPRESARAILEHAATLEVLRMQTALHFPEDILRRILCSAPNLREFHFLGARPSINTSLFAWKLDKPAWVCSKLEVFGCHIRCISRPDISRKNAEHPTRMRDTYQQFLDAHRNVYTQLGRLTKLKELTLGAGYKYGRMGRLEDCPAMTLASGLDLMKDLKDLEVVVLDNLEVGIGGAQEQTWVKENWPKIKVLSFN